MLTCRGFQSNQFWSETLEKFMPVQQHDDDGDDDDFVDDDDGDDDDFVDDDDGDDDDFGGANDIIMKPESGWWQLESN